MTDADLTAQHARELGRRPSKRDLMRRYNWGDRRANKAANEYRAASNPHPENPDTPSAPTTTRPGITTRSAGSGLVVEGTFTGRVRTLEELLSTAHVDLDTWRVDKWRTTAWEAFRADPNGPGLVTEQLHQVTATLVRRVAVDDERRLTAIRDAALAAIREAAPRRASPSRIPESGLLLELSVPDLHIGKLAWAEVGGRDFGLPLTTTPPRLSRRSSRCPPAPPTTRRAPSRRR